MKFFASMMNRLKGDSEGASAWDQYLKTPENHPQIPNISYAGYHRGERAIPRPDGPVFDVCDYGAKGDGQHDDTAAVNAAIEAAGANGGGVVLVPAGRYLLTEVLWIHHSGVVIRGSGQDETTLFFREPLETAYRMPQKGEWSWTGGLVWFIPQPLLSRLEEAQWGWGKNEGWFDNEELSAVRGVVPRGRTRIPVVDTQRFTAGDHVLLVLDNIADSSLLRHMSGDLPPESYGWGVEDSSLHKQPNYRTFRWPVEIASVEAGSVVLAQPTRLELRQKWNPRFETLGARIEESGIEDLRIEMAHVEPRPHNQDHGYNGPHFQAALNCWARNVTVQDSDNGFGITGGKGITLTDVTVEGRARHHPFICREQSHDNLVQRFLISAPTTELPADSLTHGLNIEGYSSGNVWSDGQMEGTFDSHRRFPFENVRTDITIRNKGVVGGARNAGPHWGARFCHWNIRVTNGRSYGIRLEEHAPYSAMVGIQGTTKPSQQKPEFTGELHTMIEDLGVPPVPSNLYQAQLRHRLGS
ncbi:glycosyl hydrolase family 28-related protein [Nesterenkonia sp. Act20]|uniref:glycosyl hydrolase family 28-related protein n=1 Tax=Nesterenkonia sp. Act20 TaxID=1483432 RepID=UPI001C4372BB|nr:glycosyl hydrolase family 28-related protein [Nesterenkonia sp. Act20]